MNKIITTAALLFSFLSLTYAIWQKCTSDKKVHEARLKYQEITEKYRIPTQEILIHPTKEILKKYTKNACMSIADQILTNSFSENDFGNLSRECAAVILNSLAESMPENETLEDYFSSKKTEK